MRKKIKSKPIFYAVCLPELQRIAIDNGYNLLVHGSMSRDLDLVCVAWKDKVTGHYELLEKFRKHLGAMKSETPDGKPYYSHSVKAGGRDTYIINLNYGFNSFGMKTKNTWYLDISFTPQIKKK